jgi:ribosomal protein L11 methyltransferase
LAVVVATTPADAVEACTQLGARGAGRLRRRVVGGGRLLVYGELSGADRAAAVVAALRCEGWAADVRPLGGGHLAAWRAHTAAVVVHPKLWVCFPWSETDRGDAPLVVEVDPGQGFGTGAHPSTRLLLAELADRLEGGERVLDVGCGSGILAVAALALGASGAVALDLAPAALSATRANAARNGVADRLEVADRPVGEVDERFDVVVANIGARPLVELAPAIAARLAPGGWLALSGLSGAQTSVVAAAYRPLEVAATVTDGEWSALVLIEPGR